MKRNYLQGENGDCINALLVGCGFNLRKLLRVFFWLIFGGAQEKTEHRWTPLRLQRSLTTEPTLA
jgi:hypothetical protein